MSTRSIPKPPIAVIGVGELGGVFGRALLRAGHSVHPVLRSGSIDDVAATLPAPYLALITVGETDLPHVMESFPADWRSRAGLVQNELLPRDWEQPGFTNPTVAVVWFEKKPGADVKVIIPSPIGGPQAPLLVDALAAIQIPAFVVDDRAKLEYELVRKNLYILTANIAGLVVGGTVMELWDDHRKLATAVAAEVLSIQSWLVGHPLDSGPLMDGMIDAFSADPDHGATGRSAPGRLDRALGFATAARIDVPTLRSISEGSTPDV